MHGCAPARPPAALAGARLRARGSACVRRRARGLHVCATEGGSLDVVRRFSSGMSDEERLRNVFELMKEKSKQLTPEVKVVWTATEADKAADAASVAEPLPEGAGGFLSGLRTALETGAAAVNSRVIQEAIVGLRPTFVAAARNSNSQDAWPADDADMVQAVDAMHALLCLLNMPEPRAGELLPIGCAVLLQPEQVSVMQWGNLMKLEENNYAQYGELAPLFERAERRIGALLASICRQDIPAQLMLDGDPPVDLDFKKRRVGLVGCQRLMLELITQYRPNTAGFSGNSWAGAVGLVTQGLRIVGRTIWSDYCPQIPGLAPELQAPSPEAAPPELFVLVSPALAADIALIEAHVRAFLHPFHLSHACVPSILTDLEVLDESLRLTHKLAAAGVLDWKQYANGFVINAIRRAMTRLIRSGQRDAARLLAWHCMRLETGVDVRSKPYAERNCTFDYLQSRVMDIRASYSDAKAAQQNGRDTDYLYGKYAGSFSQKQLVVSFVWLVDSDDLIKRFLDDAFYTAFQRKARLFVVGTGGPSIRDEATLRLLGLIAEVSAYGSPMMRAWKLYDAYKKRPPHAGSVAELQSVVRSFPEVPEYSSWVNLIMQVNAELLHQYFKLVLQQTPLYASPDKLDLHYDATTCLMADRAIHDALEAGAVMPDFDTLVASYRDKPVPSIFILLPGFCASPWQYLEFSKFAITELLSLEQRTWMRERTQILEVAKSRWESAKAAAKAELKRKRDAEKKAQAQAEAERARVVAEAQRLKSEAAARAAAAAAEAEMARKQAMREELLKEARAQEAKERAAHEAQAAQALQAAHEAAGRAEAALRACVDEAAEADAAAWPLARRLEAEPRWRAALAAAGDASVPAVETLRAALAPLRAATALAERLRAAVPAARLEAGSREGTLVRLRAVIADAEAAPRGVRRVLVADLAEAAQNAARLAAESALIAAVQSGDPARSSAAAEAAKAAGVDVVSVMLETLSQQAAAMPPADSPPEATRPTQPGCWVAAGPKMWVDDSVDTVLGFGSGTVVYRGVFVTERGKLEEAAVKRLVKDLKPETSAKQLKLVRREYDISRELVTKSTRVVNPLDFWEGRDFIYIGFSRCKQSLRQLLEQRRGTPLPPDLALAYLRELAAAVEDLHRCSYAHNDLHAGNVLFTDEGQLKVADLQLSMRTGSGADNTQLTMSGNRLNLKNRAPEVARNARLPAFRQAPLTPAVDVFSIGVLGLQLLTGDPSLEVRLAVPRDAQRDASPPERAAPTRGGRNSRVPPRPTAQSRDALGPRPTPVADLSALDGLRLPAHVAAEARALLRACLADNPKARPSAAAVCAHPLFWDDATAVAAMRRLYELEQMRPGIGPRDKEATLRTWLGLAGMGDAYEEFAAWQSAVHPPLLRYLTQPRGASFSGTEYSAGMVQLLRLVRNSQEHPPDPSALPPAFPPAEDTKEACRAAAQRYVRATWPRLALAAHACLLIAEAA